MLQTNDNPLSRVLPDSTKLPMLSNFVTSFDKPPPPLLSSGHSSRQQAVTGGTAVFAPAVANLLQSFHGSVPLSQPPPPLTPTFSFSTPPPPIPSHLTTQRPPLPPSTTTTTTTTMTAVAQKRPTSHHHLNSKNTKMSSVTVNSKKNEQRHRYGGGVDVSGSMPEKWFDNKFGNLRNETAFQMICDEFRTLPSGLVHGGVNVASLLRPSRLSKGSGGGPMFRTIQSQVFSVIAQKVDGFKGKKYIACEGPRRSSVYDFWEMVWQESVERILMVNQPHEERTYCAAANETIQYWPHRDGETLRFSPFLITCERTWLKGYYEDTARHDESSPLYVYRVSELILRKVDPILCPPPRKLLHICHYRWPDGQIPYSTDVGQSGTFGYARSAAVLREIMLKELSAQPRADRAQYTGPIVIHCHAGVGRTGVSIAVDVTTRRITEGYRVDVRETVAIMREQRPRAVMNIWQYAFVYASLAEVALSLGFVSDRNKARAVIDGLWRDLEEDLCEAIEHDEIQFPTDDEQLAPMDDDDADEDDDGETDGAEGDTQQNNNTQQRRIDERS